MSTDNFLPFGEDTLAKARARVFALIEEGSICPCCDRRAHARPRKLNSGMAATLCWMVSYFREHPDDRYVHVNNRGPRKVTEKFRDWTILQHWGLIEPDPSEPTKDVKTVGRWRPTQLGRDFAERRATVHQKVRTYNRDMYGEPFGPMVGIDSCLGDDFRYSDLIQNE